MRKRTLAIILSALAAVGLAGGAYAAAHSSSPPPPPPIAAAQRAFLNDAANRLHVTPARLEAALKGALIDRIDAAAAAGHLPRKFAQAIKQGIEHGSGPPFGPFPFLPGEVHAQMIAPAGALPPPVLLGGPASLSSAASYLGLSDAQLMQQLRARKSLAQIAQAHGKSKAGLVRAMRAAYASALAKAVKAGSMPSRLERKLLAAFDDQVQKIVSMKGLPAPVGVQVKAAPGAPPPLLGLLPPKVLRYHVGPRPRLSWVGPAGP